MAINHNFYKTDGFTHVKVDAPYEYVGGFLKSNISEHSTNKILDVINKLQSDEHESTVWSCGYNSDSLTLTPMYALIEPMYAEVKPCVLPVEDFKQLMQDWLIFITQ